MKCASTLTLSGPPAPLLVQMETAVRRGIPRWSLHGGPAGMMDRIRSALIQSGYSIPFATILCQASRLRAEPAMDLALAASILEALGLLRPAGDVVYIGELSLAGAVRETTGILWMLLQAKRSGIRRIALSASFRHATLLPGLEYWFLEHLSQLTSPPVFECAGTPVRTAKPGVGADAGIDSLSLSYDVKRAFAAAAAGLHHSILIGPPGTGKSTLAGLLPAFAPIPDSSEALEILALKEDTAQAAGSSAVERPVRSPHHSSSVAALIGGGVPLRAGESTRAHNGFLILDELAEFSRSALQALREPLSTGQIQLARGSHAAVLPAQFVLCATTNPCPCGHTGSPGSCRCKPGQPEAYIRRITGPLLDRIEIEMDLRPDQPDFTAGAEKIRAWIACAEEAQKERFAGKPYRFNGRIPLKDLGEIRLSLDGREEIRAVQSQSQRKLHGILRVSRTLADLEGSAEIRAVHVSEAASFACVDEIRVSGRGNA